MGMTPERRQQLLDAYGADVRRWPLSERTDALPTQVDDLDALLDAWAAPEVSPALRARVLASAPRPRSAQFWRPWIAALSASLAAACAAGIMFGVFLAQPALRAAREDAALTTVVSELGTETSQDSLRLGPTGDVG
jgi:alkanesulfonate monooxygenase SsuD/methylene tetrahydromethanopterin reductase-like flavin-dependent oxidoreductase (luciferase family)